MVLVLRAAFGLVALSLALVLGGCGGGGSCVIESPTGRTGWAACHDDWSDSECSERQDSSYSSGSCSSRGYTKVCSADGPNTFRLSSYSC